MVGAWRNPFLLLAEGKILRGREGNNLLVHACRTNSLFFLFLSLFPFFLLSFLSFLFPCFLFCDPSQVVVTVVLAFFSLLFLLSSPSPLCTARTSFYRACHGRILPFQPLTTFAWSGCTCRPPLDRLCATPHHQTKRTILFVSLSWHLFLLRCGFSLPIPYGMHLVTLAQLCPFGWCVISVGHFTQNSPGKNLKIGFSLSPPPNHAL